MRKQIPSRGGGGEVVQALRLKQAVHMPWRLGVSGRHDVPVARHGPGPRGVGWGATPSPKVAQPESPGPAPPGPGRSSSESENFGENVPLRNGLGGLGKI